MLLFIACSCLSQLCTYGHANRWFSVHDCCVANGVAVARPQTNYNRLLFRPIKPHQTSYGSHDMFVGILVEVHAPLHDDEFQVATDGHKCSYEEQVHH